MEPSLSAYRTLSRELEWEQCSSQDLNHCSDTESDNCKWWLTRLYHHV